MAIKQKITLRDPYAQYYLVNDIDKIKDYVKNNNELKQSLNDIKNLEFNMNLVENTAGVTVNLKNGTLYFEESVSSISDYLIRNEII